MVRHTPFGKTSSDSEREFEGGKPRPPLVSRCSNMCVQIYIYIYIYIYFVFVLMWHFAFSIPRIVSTGPGTLNPNTGTNTMDGARPPTQNAEGSGQDQRATRQGAVSPGGGAARRPTDPRRAAAHPQRTAGKNPRARRRRRATDHTTTARIGPLRQNSPR